MNRISFKTGENRVLGFVLSGHCTTDEQDENGKLVCSAVSSAAYMTANTITDVIGARADITLDDAYLSMYILDKIAECQPILNGFRLHMMGLAEQYKNEIEVISEV